MSKPVSGADKHAYLLMAHNNIGQLQQLITLLDDARNDIYLHVDKKLSGFQSEEIKTNASKLVFIDRIKVNWGGYSQIQCELNLLKEAAPKHYQYYHLLSGVDLPLKTQDEIHLFFDSADVHYNYIEFDKMANDTQNFLSRTIYYHFFQEIIQKNDSSNVFLSILGKMERALLKMQKKLNVHRKELVTQYKGTNWFSINDELVQFILNNEKIIRKQFRFSGCADEIFLHSLAMASPYRESIVDNSLRAIDWDRGTPYVYREEDVEGLLASDCLFARKFDSNVDQGAIDSIVEHLTKQE